MHTSVTLLLTGRGVWSLFERPFPRPCRAVSIELARRGSLPMSDGTSNPARYFGRQVRRARRAAGWTLTGFGQRIGYDPGQISRIENGRRPPTELFARMCDEAFPDLGGWVSEFYCEA